MARRFCGAALHCALLIMSLVGSGYACGEHEADAMHVAMADMPMAGMQMPASSNGENDNHSSGSQPDCSLPWVPGGCHEMSSCAPSAITPDAGPVAITVSPSRDEPLGRNEQGRSITRSPEPPPPRA